MQSSVSCGLDFVVDFYRMNLDLALKLEFTFGLNVHSFSSSFSFSLCCFIRLF